MEAVTSDHREVYLIQKKMIKEKKVMKQHDL